MDIPNFEQTVKNVFGIYCFIKKSKLNIENFVLKIHNTKKRN